MQCASRSTTSPGSASTSTDGAASESSRSPTKSGTSMPATSSRTTSANSAPAGVWCRCSQPAPGGSASSQWPSELSTATGPAAARSRTARTSASRGAAAAVDRQAAGQPGRRPAASPRAGRAPGPAGVTRTGSPALAGRPQQPGHRRPRLLRGVVVEAAAGRAAGHARPHQRAGQRDRAVARVAELAQRRLGRAEVGVQAGEVEQRRAGPSGDPAPPPRRRRRRPAPCPG